MAETSIPHSARTRMALTYAMEEARALRHNYIGQEHILIGLTRVADSAAAHILAQLGATEQLVRDAVIASVGHGTREVTGELGYSPRAKRAMQLAEERARRLGHGHVGTELVLLGLLEEGGGQGSLVLSRFGITLDITLEAVQASLDRLVEEGGRGPRGAKGFESQFAERQRGVRRHSLVLPEELFQQVQALANDEQTTVTDLLRRFAKLGLLIMETQKTPGASIVIRQGATEQRLVVL
jgi:ATP-dependent Clp protease ATP-binding subunit ClpA